MRQLMRQSLPCGIYATQEGLTGPLHPQNFCPTLLLYYTVSFSLIDVK